jgi:hypothetical protein
MRAARSDIIDLLELADKCQMANVKYQMPKGPAAFDAARAAGLHAPAIRVTRPAAPPPAKKQTIIDDTPPHHRNIARR